MTELGEDVAQQRELDGDALIPIENEIPDGGEFVLKLELVCETDRDNAPANIRAKSSTRGWWG